MDQSVVFREMELGDFLKYYEFKVNNYAEELIRAGFQPESSALAKAKEDYGKTFEAGYQTESTYFYFIENENKEDVGFVWYRIYGDTLAYLFVIFVFEAFQNQRFGLKALRLLEDECRAKGMQKIVLNVFNINTRAIRLYEKQGFQTVQKGERGRQMEKIL